MKQIKKYGWALAAAACGVLTLSAWEVSAQQGCSDGLGPLCGNPTKAKPAGSPKGKNVLPPFGMFVPPRNYVEKPPDPHPANFPDPEDFGGLHEGTQYQRMYHQTRARGFRVSANKEGGHNRRSVHPSGLAQDVPTSGMTREQIEEYSYAMRANGYDLRNEECWPNGQPKWTGPHLHVSAPPRNKTSPLPELGKLDPKGVVWGRNCSTEQQQADRERVRGARAPQATGLPPLPASDISGPACNALSEEARRRIEQGVTNASAAEGEYMIRLANACLRESGQEMANWKLSDLEPAKPAAPTLLPPAAGGGTWCQRTSWKDWCAP